MIKKYGKVIISDDPVHPTLITEFHFDEPYDIHPTIEVLLWALRKIVGQLADAEIHLEKLRDEKI